MIKETRTSSRLDGTRVRASQQSRSSSFQISQSQQSVSFFTPFLILISKYIQFRKYGIFPPNNARLPQIGALLLRWLILGKVGSNGKNPEKILAIYSFSRNNTVRLQTKQNYINSASLDFFWGL